MNIRWAPPLGIAALLYAGGSAAAQVTLNGTIRDFCAPAISEACTQLPDFEGAITGVVPDMTAPTLAGGLPAPGPNIAAGASSPATFANWYADAAGINASAPFSLTLAEGPAGVFSFGSDSFFPIDGQLFGNQGRAHNYHFTLQLGGQLSFSDPNPGATDASFTFTGDDDLWIYVNGRRFIDLGGVHAAASANFTDETLKAAGLQPDTAYPLDIFFAERHTSESNFFITTSFALAPTPVGTAGTLPLAALALGGLVWARRRSLRG